MTKAEQQIMISMKKLFWKTLFIWHKIHISSVKQKWHTGNKDYSSHRQNGNALRQKLPPVKESWQTSYSTSALKADLARCGDWIVKNWVWEISWISSNAWVRMILEHTQSWWQESKRRKQKNLPCWRAINHVWRCWKKKNSNRRQRAVSNHHKRDWGVTWEKQAGMLMGEKQQAAQCT